MKNKLTNFIFLFTLILAVVSCKKNNTVESSNIVGVWLLTSETNVGGYADDANLFNYQGRSTDKIVYNENGKAFTYIQGQYDGIYDYNLDQQNQSLLFLFVHTDDRFMITQPCIGVSGCLRRTFIKSLTASNLVLENTFSATINGTYKTLKITDSFSRQ